LLFGKLATLLVEIEQYKFLLVLFFVVIVRGVLDDGNKPAVSFIPVLFYVL